MAEILRKCQNCDLIILYGNIFDAFDKGVEKGYGPILGLHREADKEHASAGYVGLGSLDPTDSFTEMYRCPRCKSTILVHQ